jgi:hypothetical protein
MTLGKLEDQKLEKHHMTLGKLENQKHIYGCFFSIKPPVLGIFPVMSRPSG